mmetsp:Transcript_10887/g.29279  ORF Transcript_10887/g.29279 Transcript_10887/m.29279 type:complete len:388 (+) Transcript_10887:260-1423(+)
MWYCNGADGLPSQSGHLSRWVLGEPGEPPFLGRAALAAPIEELADDCTKVLQERILVFGILLNVLAELLVLDEDDVRRQHHEVTCGVLELQRALPRLALVGRLDGPRVLDELAVVLVAHCGRGARPRTPETGAVRVARAESVRTAQGHDLPIVEAHAVENVTQVRGRLVRAAHVRAREPPILVRGTLPDRALFAAGLVCAARRELDLGAAHLLDGHNRCENPQVRVRHARELLLHGLEHVLRELEARIGTPRHLGLEAHRSTIRAARVRVLAESAGRVPTQTKEKRPWCRSIIRRVHILVVVEHLHDFLPDGIPINRRLARADTTQRACHHPSRNNCGSTGRSKRDAARARRLQSGSATCSNLREAEGRGRCATSEARPHGDGPDGS